MEVVIIKDEIRNVMRVIRPSEEFTKNNTNRLKYKELIYDLNRPLYGKSKY